MLNLARAVDLERFSTQLIVLGPADGLAGELPPGISVERLNAARLRSGLPRLVSVLRRIEPDVVVSTLGYINLGLLAVRGLIGRSTRLIVREANTVSATLRAMPPYIPARWLYSRLYPAASSIIVQTAEIAAEIEAIAPSAKARISLLSNPVDEAGLRAHAARPVRVPGAGLRLVTAGRLTRQKGFDRLIALVPQLPNDTHLTIFGEGPDRALIEAQIRQHGLIDRVSLPGHSSQLAAAMAGADCFVLPSRWEGMPNVVLEALALGTPVLASDEAKVEQIAREAPPGAVRIAPVNDSFVLALRGISSRTEFSLRGSLLPNRYQFATVSAEFTRLLLRVVSAAA